MQIESKLTGLLVSRGYSPEDAVVVEAAIDDLRGQAKLLDKLLAPLNDIRDIADLEAVLVGLQLHLQHGESHLTEAREFLSKAIAELATPVSG